MPLVWYKSARNLEGPFYRRPSSAQIGGKTQSIRIAGYAAKPKVGYYRRGGFDVMTVWQLAIAPQYVSFYAAGCRSVDIPTHMDRRGVLSSKDCVLIPSVYWYDGDTHVTFGPASEITEAREPDFDGMLNTPNKELILFDANEPQYAATTVPSITTRIRIWMDHPTEPENIVIAWG